MSKVVGLLSFYDETEAFLHRLIASLPLAGVEHLVALDGRYQTFPALEDVSPSEQHEAIEAACDMAGIGLTLHVQGPWASEIEKRSALFALGEKHTQPDDWYWIADGDEQVTHAQHVHDVLDHTPFDVAQVTMTGRDANPQFPKYFRAIRGLHVYANHYTYRTPDHRYLWGNQRTTLLQPRAIVNLTVHHHERTARRRTQAVGYYATRDQAGDLEHHNPLRHAA
jgi:hypothetical protein